MRVVDSKEGEDVVEGVLLDDDVDVFLSRGARPRRGWSYGWTARSPRLHHRHSEEQSNRPGAVGNFLVAAVPHDR